MVIKRSCANVLLSFYDLNWKNEEKTSQEKNRKWAKTSKNLFWEKKGPTLPPTVYSGISECR